MMTREKSFAQRIQNEDGPRNITITYSLRATWLVGAYKSAPAKRYVCVEGADLGETMDSFCRKWFGDDQVGRLKQKMESVI